MAFVQLSNVNIKKYSLTPPVNITGTPWKRDASWLTIPSLSETDEKFVGLIAVWPERNFTAFTAAGAYDVDWGDGTSGSYTSGQTALKEFDYTNPTIADTDAPVTLVSSTNRIERISHGYSSGDTIKLWNVTGSTGVTNGQQYYVINVTANDFQISETPDGPSIILGVDGTATLLPYKQAIVSVTPQVGQQLTALNLNVRHTLSGLGPYETGWLDLEISSPNFTSSGLVIRTSSETVRMRMVERIRLATIGNQTSTANMFYNCLSLQSVPLFDTSNVTTTSGMFVGCFSLQSVPLFDTTNVTNMSSMFLNCYSLLSVPLFDTSNVTAMSSMFQSCYSLPSVPLFDTGAVTNMASMFRACAALQSVPLFDTTNVTNMSLMFLGCYSLLSIPLFDTSNVTNMSTMFQSCYSLPSVPLFDTSNVTAMSSMFRDCTYLRSIPLFDTSNVTNMQNMFQTCISLKSVPLLDTTNVTNMTSMFYNCYALQSVPLFDTTNVTNMTSMFQGCSSLQSVPLFDTSNVTNMTSMFNACTVLRSIPSMTAASVTSTTELTTMFLNCSNLSSMTMTGFNYSFSIASANLDGPALDAIYTALPTVVGQTITVTGNYGIATHDPTIATAKGWTVAV